MTCLINKLTAHNLISEIANLSEWAEEEVRLLWMFTMLLMSVQRWNHQKHSPWLRRVALKPRPCMALVNLKNISIRILANSCKRGNQVQQRNKENRSKSTNQGIRSKIRRPLDILDLRISPQNVHQKLVGGGKIQSRRSTKSRKMQSKESMSKTLSK